VVLKSLKNLSGREVAGAKFRLQFGVSLGMRFDEGTDVSGEFGIFDRCGEFAPSGEVLEAKAALERPEPRTK
jgi:hypothetical protein